MLKMVCDKCGKAVFTTSVESISMRNRITILDRQYDLCRECKLKVMMFIDGKMPYEDCEDCETHLKAQKDKPTTQTETQNSNLTFEKDECAKEYEELGLKELKELIEADHKTEPTGYNLSPVEDEPTISKMEQVDEPQTGEMMTEEEFDSMLARVLTGNNEPQTDYERASEQREHDILYEPTYDLDDGSM